MRKELCLVLAKHAGQTITRELALQMVQDLCGADAPIDLARFQAQEHSGYVIQAERFADVLPELIPLHGEHWLETEKWRKGLPLNPDYEAMAERERVGQLLQITARHEGALVGHVRMYLNRSLHTGTHYAEEDTLYLQPDHRGGFLAIQMMRYAEASLLALGVREIRANSKLVNRADVLMRRLGYEAVALQFCKIFEEPSQ